MRKRRNKKKHYKTLTDKITLARAIVPRHADFFSFDPVGLPVRIQLAKYGPIDIEVEVKQLCRARRRAD